MSKKKKKNKNRSNPYNQNDSSLVQNPEDILNDGQDDEDVDESEDDSDDCDETDIISDNETEADDSATEEKEDTEVESTEEESFSDEETTDSLQNDADLEKEEVEEENIDEEILQDDLSEEENAEDSTETEEEATEESEDEIQDDLSESDGADLEETEETFVAESQEEGESVEEDLTEDRNIVSEEVEDEEYKVSFDDGENKEEGSEEEIKEENSESMEKEPSETEDETVQETEKTLDEESEEKTVLEEDSLTEEEITEETSEETNQQVPPANNGKPKMSKGLKLGIIFGSIALAIALAITVILVIFNFKVILVKNADDFNDMKDDGSIYILCSNVVVDGDLELARAYPINLRSHTLTINGNLVVKDESSTKAFYIGGAKNNFSAINKNDFYYSGKIVAKSFSVDLPSASVVVKSDIALTEDMTVNGKEVGIYGSVSAGDFIFTAENGTVTISESGTLSGNNLQVTAKNYSQSSALTIKNQVDLSAAESVGIGFGVGEAIVNIKKAQTTTVNFGSYDVINLAGSELIVAGKSVIQNLIVTKASDIKVTDATVGNIEGKTQESVKVVLEGTATVGTVKNISKVTYYEGSNVGSFIGIGNLIYVSTLETPANAKIAEIDGEYYFIVSTVVNADFYNVYLDGEFLAKVNALDSGDSVSLNLSDTDFINPGKHTVSVEAGSNYSYFKNSGKLSIDHVVSLKIKTPYAQIKVDDDKIYVEITKVLYANQWIVTINGKDHPFSITPENLQSYEITEYLTKGSSNNIEVVARNDEADEFLDSDVRLLSYIYYVTLSAPVFDDEAGVDLQLVKNFSPDSLTVSWGRVNNAEYYEIIVNGSESIYALTKDTTYTFSATEINNFANEDGTFTLAVRCKTTGYYKESNAVNGVYTKINPTKVSNVNVVDEGEGLLISWDAIESADSYTVYLVDNGYIELATVETNSYNIPAEYKAAGNVFAVKMNAESIHYNDVSVYSEDCVYKVPLDNSGIIFTINGEKISIANTNDDNVERYLIRIINENGEVIVGGDEALNGPSVEYVFPEKFKSAPAGEYTIKVKACPPADSDKYTDSEYVSKVYNKA